MRTKFLSWKKLQEIADTFMRADLKSAQRKNQNNESLVLSLDGFKADFRASVISSEIFDLLLKLGEECGFEDARDKLFQGEPINNTEQRAVMHMALRAQEGDHYPVDGRNVVGDVIDVRERFLSFAERVRTGQWLGHTGQPIKDVVNIGIGGSDLGPNMVCEALKAYDDALRVHFVSNVDGAHMADCIKTLAPETTLFIITSKTFTTQETLLNAETARAWVKQYLGDHKEVVKRHFVAVSTNAEAVQDFGISLENMFPFWGWVGGRFSLWSAVGLSIALQIGRDHFLDFLRGANAMDEHFLSAPMEKNIPVLSGLYGVFYRSFLKMNALAILPYAQRLHLLPSYLQQLEMESNGKNVARDGVMIDYPTCPVIFGQAGTNGQHAFYQMLHQGKDIIPCDFIAVKTVETDQTHHKILNAHLSAQMEAFRDGQDLDQARQKFMNDDLKAKHSVFSGGRPCHLYQLPQLSPYYLGMLLALYEHKVFVQGVIWDLNSFDQWGVQLGKELSKKYI